MKCATRKLRPAVKWHGGKTYLARRIIALFPEHSTYIEPFAGGLSVLLNKPESADEVANDLNSDLIQFYRDLRDDSQLIVRAQSTPYEEKTFRNALEYGRDSLAFLVRNRFSRGGLGKDFAWSDRLRGGQPGDVNAWKTIVDDLPEIRSRIYNVRLMNRDAVEVIQLNDSPETLIYADPPYLPEVRSSKSIYDHEMSFEGHEWLLSVLRGLSSKVVLSGYRSPLYKVQLGGWNRHDFEIANHSGQGAKKQRRVECVWCNF